MSAIIEVTPENPLYVTQWAVTRGVLVFTEGQVQNGHFGMKHGFIDIWVNAQNYSFNRIEAETRWQTLMLKKVKSTKASLAKMEAQLEQRPPVKPWRPG